MGFSLIFAFVEISRVRKVDMLEGVSILRSKKVKDELVLDGSDIELVSRSAALINQVTFLNNIPAYEKHVVYYLHLLRIEFVFG